MAARLGQAYVQGRLTLEELSQRTRTAYCACTWGELDQLLADLPDQPDLAHVYHLAGELLATAARLGISRGELVALLLCLASFPY